MILKKVVLLFLISLSIPQLAKSQEAKEGFVTSVDQKFYINAIEYSFLGANYWQGMNLGAPKSGDRDRLLHDLDHLQDLGITNLRVLAASEADSDMKYCALPALQIAPGVYNEDIWQGLDFLLIEMKKRNMKAVMVLGNFWTWSGGFPQYLKWSRNDTIPFPQDPEYSWQNFTDYAKQFYLDEKAQKMMDNHIKKVILRKNSISGILYKEDPTVMSWEIANEPRGYDIPEKYREWTRKTTAYIKQLDKDHLVCLGTEGNTASYDAGVAVLLDNDDPNVDYISMHIWPQNWSWFEPAQGEKVYQEALKKVDAYWNDHLEAAKKLNKPIVLEEFGIARDNSSFDPEATTLWRDRFFTYLFEKVATSHREGTGVCGVNFWSYSGNSTPPRPGEYWKIGDVLIGDPPHELQGWYGVYEKDLSTLEIVKKFAVRIK